MDWRLSTRRGTQGTQRGSILSHPVDVPWHILLVILHNRNDPSRLNNMRSIERIVCPIIGSLLCFRLISNSSLLYPDALGYSPKLWSTTGYSVSTFATLYRIRSSTNAVSFLRAPAT